MWGSTWLVIKQGLETLPPLIGAGAALRRRGRRDGVHRAAGSPDARAADGRRSSRSFRTALCQFVLNFALVYVSETIMPSGLVSVLWSIFPLIVALTGHFVTKSERLVGRQWFGMLVGFGGIVVLFATDLRQHQSARRDDGMLLLARAALRDVFDGPHQAARFRTRARRS